jgi:hypothetical protein
LSQLSFWVGGFKSACWAFVATCGLSAAVATSHGGQLVGPSSVPLGGPAIASKALSAAWLRLAVRFGRHGTSGADGRSATIELTVPSGTGERPISTVRIRSVADFESVTKGGRLTFRDVPTRLPIWLRISVRSSEDAVLCAYTRSYVLRLPDQDREARLGAARALEESGYLGDFVISATDAEIARTIAVSVSSLLWRSRPSNLRHL